MKIKKEKLDLTPSFDLGNFTLEPLPEKNTRVLSAEAKSEESEQKNDSNLSTKTNLDPIDITFHNSKNNNSLTSNETEKNNFQSVGKEKLNKNLNKTDLTSNLGFEEDKKTVNDLELERSSTALNYQNNFTTESCLGLTEKVTPEEHNFDLGNLRLEKNVADISFKDDKDKIMNPTSNFELVNSSLEPLSSKSTQILSAEKNIEKAVEPKNINQKSLEFDTSLLSNNVERSNNSEVSEINKNNYSISSLDIFQSNDLIAPDTVVNPKVEDINSDPFASFNDLDSTITQNKPQEKELSDPFDLFGQMQSTPVPDTKVETNTTKDPFDLFG